MSQEVVGSDFSWKSLVEGSPDGILAFDREFRYTVWNRAMERIAGTAAEQVLGRVAWEVFPFLKEEGEDAYFAAALAGEMRRTAHRPFRIPTSGREGYFQAEYAPLRDASGQVTGGMALVRETTDVAHTEEALRMQALILESMTEGVCVADEDGFIVYTNAAEDRMFGYAPGELVGKHVTVQNAYPPEENRRIVAEVMERLRTGGVWAGEWTNVRKDGTSFLTRSRITALELAGRPHWVCVQEDITQQRRAEAENARLLDRIEFLATASKALASSLDYERTLSTVAHLAVPFLADWCFVEALRPDGSIELLAVGHSDPQMEEFARDAIRRYPVDPAAAHGAGKVIRTGEPELVPQIPPELLAAVARDEEHLRILERVGFRSHVSVPLSVHGRVIGALSLVQSESGRRFSEADLPLVQELALRAALAIDKARLYRTAKESGALLDTLFQTAPVALGFVDRELRYRRVNDMLAHIDRLAPEDMIGRTLREVVPEIAPTVEPLYRRVLEQGEEIRNREVSGPRPGFPGEVGHWLTNYTAVRAPDGEVLGVGMAALDITDRKRSEEGQRLLVDASEVLADSLEVQQTLDRLARLVVDRMADACAIDLASAGGALERVAVMSRDPGKVETVQELERRYPTPPDSPAGHATAFRTGEPQLYSGFPDELLRSASVDEEHFRLWKALQMESVLNVPLITRGRTLGVITLVSHTPGKRFSAADLELACELARRAALAIDNARLYTESREANRAKTDFLAAMSHELRTPLNAISGYVDLIDAGIHGPVTEAQRHALNRVKRSQEYLLRLINDVLHFVKLEAGRLEFDICDVPLSEVLDAIASSLEPQADARGVAYSTHPCDPSLRALADPDRVRQILLNLVGNALKFTPSGGWVLVRCEADDERVSIHVQDNGRGIPADRIHAVFDPFVQLDRHRNESSQQGVGLGLSISRDLARGMGGDLVVQSEEGRGSTFTLTLPRSLAQGR